MGPIKSIGICFVRFSEFSGRSARSEYWWFFAFSVICFFAVTFIDTNWFGLYPMSEPMVWLSIGSGFIVVTHLPILAVGYRRLQDTGLPGWIYMALTALAYSQIAPPNQVTMTFSMVASIMTIILCPRKSQPASNRFGPNPNEVIR